jgi:SAM-dependent methyltransferase
MIEGRDSMIRSSYVPWVGKIHGKLVHSRRVEVLADRIKTMMPACSTLLDIGCGDGTIARHIAQEVSGLKITGVEYSPRADCAIPCDSFDGVHLPYADKSFDCSMFVDVLHHTLDPLSIVRDASRVSRSFIIIKDHIAQNAWDYWILRLMDWVGNRPHGVVLPYAYLSSKQWKKLYDDVGLTEKRMEQAIPIYPAPFSWIFGRKLHFISVMAIDPAPKN